MIPLWIAFASAMAGILLTVLGYKITDTHRIEGQLSDIRERLARIESNLKT